MGGVSFTQNKAKARRGIKVKVFIRSLTLTLLYFIIIIFWLKYIYFTKESKKFRITKFFTISYHNFDVAQFNW